MTYNILSISNIAFVVYVLYKYNDDFKKNTMITSINRRLDKTILTINEILDKDNQNR